MCSLCLCCGVPFAGFSKIHCVRCVEWWIRIPIRFIYISTFIFFLFAQEFSLVVRSMETERRYVVNLSWPREPSQTNKNYRGWAMERKSTAKYSTTVNMSRRWFHCVLLHWMYHVKHNTEYRHTEPVHCVVIFVCKRTNRRSIVCM